MRLKAAEKLESPEKRSKFSASAFFCGIISDTGNVSENVVRLILTTPLKPLCHLGDMMLKPRGSSFGRGGHAL